MEDRPSRVQVLRHRSSAKPMRARQAAKASQGREGLVRYRKLPGDLASPGKGPVAGSVTLSAAGNFCHEH